MTELGSLQTQLDTSFHAANAPLLTPPWHVVQLILQP